MMKRRVCCLLLAVLLVLSMGVPASARERDQAERKAVQAERKTVQAEYEVLPETEWQRARAKQVPQPQAELMADRYYIEIGNAYFYSDGDYYGDGWYYEAADNLLVLDNYQGGGIYAEGDLVVATYGVTKVYGSDGGAAIYAAGRLELYANGEELWLFGGHGVNGGDAIYAPALYLETWCQNTFIVGGEGTEYGGAAVSCGVAELNCWSQGEVTFLGGSATGSGGYGGEGVLANELVLYGDMGTEVSVMGGISELGYAGVGINVQYGDLYAYCSVYGGIGLVNGMGIFVYEYGNIHLDSRDINIFGNPPIYWDTGAEWSIDYHCEAEFPDDSTVVIVPHWYTLTIRGNGGKLPDGKTKTDVRQQYPSSVWMEDYIGSRNGYVQVGWQFDGRQLELDAVITPEENCDVSAVWTPAKNGDIILHGLGGRFSDGKHYKHISGGAAQLPENLTYTEDMWWGHGFGWSDRIWSEIDSKTGRLAGTWYTDGAVIEPAPNGVVQIYAQQRGDDWVMACHLGEGTADVGGNLMMYASYGSEFSAPSAAAVTAPEGYKLAGWATEPDGKAVYKPGDKVPLGEAYIIRLYAVWEEDTIRIPLFNGLTATYSPTTGKLSITGKRNAAYMAVAAYGSDHSLTAVDFAPVSGRTVALSLDTAGLDSDALSKIVIFTLDGDYAPKTETCKVPIFWK